MSISAGPINVPPSLFWEGIDGSWSTFHVQVGTPGQTVRLLPGTSASAADTTWVIRPEGCTQANPNLTDCDNSRGLLFDPEKSTSWSTERLDNGGLFTLNTYYEKFLNLTGNAYYGFETLTLGLPGSGLPSVEQQIIAGIGTNNYWLGSLGLSPIPFNFSTQNDSTNMLAPQPALLTELKNQSHIPSLSWSYTAGASYRNDPVFGSLVLGGYDTGRYEPNNVTFAFASDFSRDLTVYLQSVAYDTIGSSLLLTESIPIFINSLVTHLWLPTDVCKRFEDAFNLTWSDKAKLYLVDDDTHSRLLKLNPTINFTIGHAGTGGDTVDISLPYGAFDLSGSPPFVSPASRYFPLKRATEPDQYTLGRVFLQGAYVIADYERQTFSVSQALFPDASKTSNSTIKAIDPPGKASQKSSLPAGAIAGIVIGAILGIAIIILAVLWLLRRHKRKTQYSAMTAETFVDKSEHIDTVDNELDGREPQLHELENPRHKGSELDGIQPSLMELDSQSEQKVELSGDGKGPQAELAGDGKHPRQVHELP